MVDFINQRIGSLDILLVEHVGIKNEALEWVRRRGTLKLSNDKIVAESIILGNWPLINSKLALRLRSDNVDRFSLQSYSGAQFKVSSEWTQHTYEISAGIYSIDSRHLRYIFIEY